MPQLRSGKVVRASEVQPADWEVTSPDSPGIGCEPGEKLVVERSPRLAPKRKPEQPLPSCLRPARLSIASLKCFAPVVPVQQEQGENSQKFPGKKSKGIQHRSAARRSKGVDSPVSDTAACEDWQAAATAAAMCWEEAVRRGTGQSQQLFFSGTTLQNKFLAGIERKEHFSADLNCSGFQEGSGSLGKEGRYSGMEIKSKIPSSEEEIESVERCGISCFPEPGGLQPKKVTWSTEMKCTNSIMMQNMQIPDLKKNLGAQEGLCEPKQQEEVDTPEKLNGCPLVGSRMQGTQQKEKRCLGKKDGISVMNPKHGPRKRSSSALLEEHTQCPESRKGALSKRNRNALLSEPVQGLSGQEKPTTRRKTQKRCMNGEQQSSSPQKGPDSPGESGKEQLKAIEQDFGTSQAVKKVKTKQNRSEDYKEKESHYSRSSTVATLGGTQSRSFLCHAVTKKSGMRYEKRQDRPGEIKHLQSLSVTAAKKVINASAEYDAEHCSNALNRCSGLLCAREKNPFVILEDCSYINTLVKPSASGATTSCKLNGFFHVVHGTGDLNDRICRTSRMQNERSPIKGGLSSNKEKNENEEGCFSCCLSETSKCLRGKKWNIGRRPRKKIKLTEKSTDMASKCSACGLQTEAGVAVSSSFAVSGLNHTTSALCDRTSDSHTEKNTDEVRNVSAWRKNSTKLLAFQSAFKKTSEFSVVAKGENSSSVAHHSASSGSLRVLAQINEVSDCHKSKIGKNLNKVNKKLQQFTCQRTVPMTGKKIWPVESCARTSEWVRKNHRSIPEGKRLLKAAFEDFCDKSSVKAVGDSAMTGNFGQLDLHMSSAEITKESTHKKIDKNTECQTSLQPPESSSVVVRETLRMSNENGESPVNTDKSAVAFNHDDVQEVKATLNFTAKQKDKNEGDVRNRNLSATVQNGTTKQKGKGEGNVTNRNLPVTVQNGTTKQKDKEEGDMTNRKVSVTVQNVTTKQKDKNEGDVTNRNLSMTVRNATTKQKDKNEGDVRNRNVSVTVQNGTTKQKDKNEGDMRNGNLPVTVQKGTTKQKDKGEGNVTNRNVSVTVQNGTTKQKDKDEGDVRNRNVSVTIQNGTTKQKDKEEGDITNRNLPVTVQNGTTKQNDKNEGNVTNRNLSVTVQKGTTKQKDKGEGNVTNRNLPVTVQNGTTKQKDKNEADVRNRNLHVTVQNGTTKQKDKEEGDVTNRNVSVTVQNGTTKQKDKNEADVTNRNVSVTVQNGTTKQKDKEEGDVTNRNVSVTVQNGTTKQKDKDEGDVRSRNLHVTVQNGTPKQKDKEEGDVTNRNLSVTVQNGTTKQKDKKEGDVRNRNLPVTVQIGTTKQNEKDEGDVTNGNLPVIAQNGTTKQKEEGDMRNRNLPVTVQNGTSTGNTTRINCSPKVSVANQTLSDLKLIKPLSSGNLTKFKIPVCRSKPESMKLESVHSFERKTCSPLELLESTGVSRSQKTGEETFLVNSEQHPLPVMGDASSTASIQKKADEISSKDFQRDGSVNLSDEMFVLPESFSVYPHPLLDGQPESSVPNFFGTECVLKPSFPDHSWNSVNQLFGLEINDDRKSRGNLSQHKSQNLPDIIEAYKQDVLVIDVIQDDPDLFGTNNEEELAPAPCENCPVKASSTNCIKDTKQYIKPESSITSEKTDSVENSCRCMQESGMSNDTENSCNLVLKAEDVKTHNSSKGSSPSGDVSEDFLKDRQQSKLDEVLKSFDVDEKFKFADGVPDVEEEKKSDAEKSDCKYKVNCELLSGLPLNDPKVNLFSEATVMKSWTNGYKPSGRSPLLPLKNCGDLEPWKMEKNTVSSHSVQQILDALNLPRKYCRYYFMTSRGCERAKCWFCHVPRQGDEKICMAILRTYISIKESGLLKRAVQIFVQYYREVIPGVDFASEVLNDLLVSLLNNCLLQEVFQILNVVVQIKTLPAVDILLKVFEHVSSLEIRNAVPALISTFCKLIDAGMFLELEHFDYIIKLLHQLQVSSWEISTVLNIKSRFKERYFEKTWIFDFNLAVAEIQHCNEKRDWTKLGALYLNARTGCEHFDDLQKLFLSIAEILTKDSETDRPGVPFCDFADSVMKNSHHNEPDRIFIGRTGISVMYSYHKVLQWIKGRKVLDKLHELRIQFTLLKGLVGAGRSASRCQIVNKAAEIFLHSGCLDEATRVLRESEWTTDAPLWPCDKMDILNRHNLLCAIVHKYLRKSLYRQAFEVLQNLPGLQNHSDIVDASQYSCLFNKLINACFENKNLGVSSSAVDFMLSKKIPIDFFLLRRLITALGRSSLWSKARTYYKNALSLGCYPQLQGNLYHKLLKIPSYLSEVEMLLAIEIFLVSNASDIQSPRTTSQTLQIILKRCEDQTVQNNSAYHVAVERLIQAARLSDPKLFLKHMTMNVNMEEVYSLDHSSALKWLQENMKWAEKVWLFQ